MITITTDHGTFEGETMTQAKRQADAAKRVAEKRAKRQSEMYRVAIVRAEATAWRMAKHKMKGEKFPRSWTYIPDGASPYGSTKATVTQYKGAYTSRRTALKSETGDGDADWELSVHEFIGHVEGGTGMTLAVAVRNGDTGMVEVYAVGIAEGVAALEDIPGVQPHDFRQLGEKVGGAGDEN